MEELNVAYGFILYIGHSKDKTSDRTYRTISKCPFLAINDSTNMILIPGVPADVLPLDNPRGHDVTPICVGKEGH